MTDFNLRAAINAVMDETDLTQPEEIATRVVKAIPASQIRAVLTALLRDYIRIQFHRGPAPSSAAPPKTAGRSAKVVAIRAAAPGWLRKRVHVGDSKYLLLGQCSYENLLYLAAERLANAERSTAAAAEYRDLAETVKRHRVACVADLPAELLAAWRSRRTAAA